MRAAVYCRVSTKAQAEDGTSLQTQAHKCITAAVAAGLVVPDEFVFSEDWPGDTLERPLLAKLRSVVRAKDVDAVFCYATDRLSRNPVHLFILAEEADKAGVGLHL